MDERLLRNTMAVVLNTFNQPTYLLRTVSTLLAHEFKNIWVLDQASTFPDALKALSLLERTHGVQVLRLRQNFGPRWFFTSPLIDLVGSVFAYSDVDLEFKDPLPPTFLKRLHDLSIVRRQGKVGCALNIAEADQFIDRVLSHNGRHYTIAEWEQQFWATELEPDVFDAPVDTTFAVYNKNFFSSDRFLRGIRVAGDWTARHRPWYRDHRVPENEWNYYLSVTRHSGWFNEARPAPSTAP